jgi:hypothetical protein
MDWRCGSSGIAPLLLAQSPESNPSTKNTKRNQAKAKQGMEVSFNCKEHLSSKCEALSLISSTTKTKPKHY